MRAGKMDRLVVIEAPTRTQGATGEPAVTWSTFATVWAEKKDIGGREYFAAQQLNGEITTKFWIRYLSGLKMEMRITCDGLVYDITNIAEMGRRAGMEILAKAAKT